MNLKEVILFCLLLSLITGCKNAHPGEGQFQSYSKYELIRISSNEPSGWLKQVLEFQKSGLTGHIEAAGHPFNTGMWTERIALDNATETELNNSLNRDGAVEEDDEGVFWWPYEQSGYYIDGAIKCAYLLGDSLLLNRARFQTEYLLQHPGESGRLGPAKLIGRWYNWPYAGLFRAFITEYEETGNHQIVESMLRHYHTFVPEDFQDELDVCNIEELCWLFKKTGDSAMIEMAEKSFELFKSTPENRNRDGRDIQFTSNRVPDYHGVVYLEIVKIPALLYSVTGKTEYLQEALLGIEKMEQYHMLASGLPSTTEHFSGIHEKAGHETCNLATLPYTYGIMLRITGDGKWADKIEKAVFNAGLGAITKDFRAHQYFSAPNQMIATTHTQHFGYYPSNMAYCPGHTVSCCTGNMNRMMPYYAMQMWLKTKSNGLAAALFGPSKFSAEVGKKETPVTIVQRTRYPFEERIEFEIFTKNRVTFDFQIRIPGWCSNPELSINGERVNAELLPGSFYSLEREFRTGDLVELSIPMQVNILNWPHGGISFERGPVVFSLPIRDSSVIVSGYEKSTSDFPAFDLYPEEEWQYCPEVKKAADIRVIKNERYTYPWNPDTPPIMLKLPAKKVQNWDLIPVSVDGSALTHYQIPGFPQKPTLSSVTDTIELIPYGSTLLRVTLFPQSKP